MRYAVWTFEGQGRAIQLEKEDTYRKQDRNTQCPKQ